MSNKVYRKVSYGDPEEEVGIFSEDYDGKTFNCNYNLEYFYVWYCCDENHVAILKKLFTRNTRQSIGSDYLLLE